MNGIITNIKRFAVHDGDGIRTTVFFKGCPLKCVWCHNPETISVKKQIAFYSHKCIGCKKCGDICKCHIFDKNTHIINRNSCTLCGKCADVCPKDAIEIFGKEMTVEEIYSEVIKDKSFYDTSGGGVTLSGGECLLQWEFCLELLKKLKKDSINTAVDTCGFTTKEVLDKVMPYTDTFLYDIKAFDEEVHKKCTGVSNKLILENLIYLDKAGKRIEVRIPYVPQYNSNEVNNILEFLKDLKNIVKIRMLPYHNYAASKYQALEMKNTLPDTLPEKSEIEALQTTADEIIIK